MVTSAKFKGGRSRGLVGAEDARDELCVFVVARAGGQALGNAGQILGVADRLALRGREAIADASELGSEGRHVRLAAHRGPGVTLHGPRRAQRLV